MNQQKVICMAVNSNANGSGAQFSMAAVPVTGADGKLVPQRPQLVITVGFSDLNAALKFQVNKEYSITIE